MKFLPKQNPIEKMAIVVCLLGVVASLIVTQLYLNDWRLRPDAMGPLNATKAFFMAIVLLVLRIRWDQHWKLHHERVSLYRKVVFAAMMVICAVILTFPRVY